MAAIVKDSGVAVYFSNAATCYSRMNEPERALELINEAIRLDPTFIKALYRRGVALMELKRFQEASEDFVQVCQEFPSDLEAQKRLKACDKEIDRKYSFDEAMRAGFSAAIRIDKFELSRKCIEAMTVDASYSGPVVDFNQSITMEWIRDTLIPHFYSDQKLNIKYAYAVKLNNQSGSGFYYLFPPFCRFVCWLKKLLNGRSLWLTFRFLRVKR